MEADSLKADNKKIWIRGQFVEVTDPALITSTKVTKLMRRIRR